jgi:Holliday junction resolvasome RuvABC endonuclease subunit
LAFFDEPIAPKSVEFSVKEDFIDRLPEILSNVEEIKKWAVQQTAYDQSLVLVTEEDFDTAKKRCAEINRVVKAIDEKRMAVKKKYTAPYNEFEKSIKGVTQILLGARENLWSQIQNAEDKKKEEKRKVIQEYYKERIGEYAKYKPFDIVFSQKWLNKTARLETVYAEIDKIVEQAVSDVDAIQSLDNKDSSALLLMYSNGASLSQVMQNYRKLQEMRECTAEVTTETEPAEESEERIDLVEISFKVKCTLEQVQKLKEFLVKNHIEYGRA